MGLATFVYSRGALLTIYMKCFVFQDDPERSVLHRPRSRAEKRLERGAPAYATRIVYSVPIEEVGYCKEIAI